MRASSRPQRHARSGVTYKESDDDDDEFVPTAKVSSDFGGRKTRGALEAVDESAGIAKGKRTLTLKRVRIVEPPVTVTVAKVDEEVQRAVRRAGERPSASPGLGIPFPQVYEAAERVLNSHRGKSSAFEYLLDAVSGATGYGEEEGQLSSPPKVIGARKEAQEEAPTSAGYDPELLAAYSAFERKLQAVRGVKEESAVVMNGGRRVAVPFDEECILVQEAKHTVVTERDKNGRPDDEEKPSADEKRYVRRVEKVKSDELPSADAKGESKDGGDDKEHIVSSVDNKKGSATGEEDKPYTMSSADKFDEDNADAGDSWNESSDASDSENKLSVKQKSDAPVSAKNPSQDLKSFAKNSNLPNSNPSTAAHILMPAKSTIAPPLLPKKRPALWVGTKPFVPPGPQTLQTPTVAHRRVLGLSRRHRPPPLHPYLLGS